MSDDYLFDKSGAPDERVADLERALAPARYRAPATPRAVPATRRRVRARILAFALATTASVALAAAAVLGVGRVPEAPVAPGSLVTVRAVEGAPRVGDSALPRASSRVLPEGAWLTTTEGATAEILLAKLGNVEGRVTVSPGSKLRLTAASATEQRLELVTGRIEALVVAPPRLFVVGVPGAEAIDLGCAYSLEVVGDGVSRLRVRSGSVELAGKAGLASWVPAGAACETPIDATRGHPWFEDASAAFVDALRRHERAPDASAIRDVLHEARPRDTLTLWHLAARTRDPGVRAEIEAKLVALAPPRDGRSPRDPAYLDDLVTHW